MQASSSGSISTAGSSAGASAATTTSDHRTAPSGSARSERTAMIARGPPARTASSTTRARSRRSSSAISTLGRESVSPYSISVGVHHAFMPTIGGTDRHDRPVAHDPFGIVAHRHGYAVAGAHAVGLVELVGECPHLGPDLGVGVPLVFVDEVVLVAVSRRQLPHGAQVRRGRAEDLDRDTPHLDLRDGEGTSGSGQLPTGRRGSARSPRHHRSCDVHHARRTGRSSSASTSPRLLDRGPGDRVDHELDVGGPGRGEGPELIGQLERRALQR